MVWEHFQICGVQITTKYIFWVNELKEDTVTHET